MSNGSIVGSETIASFNDIPPSKYPSRNIPLAQKMNQVICELSLSADRDEFSFGNAFAALQKRGDSMLSMQLLSKIPSPTGTLNKNDVYRNTVMYNSVLAAFKVEGSGACWREALKIYDDLVSEAAFGPDRTSKAVILAVLMRCKQFSIAAAIREGYLYKYFFFQQVKLIVAYIGVYIPGDFSDLDNVRTLSNCLVIED